MIKTKKHYILFLLYALILSLFLGCSDESKQQQKELKNQEEKQTKQTPHVEKTDYSKIKEATPQMIEVVQNKNVKQIKVKQKKADENQSKSYYYSYNNKSAINEKQKTSLDASLHIRSPYEKVQVSMLVKKLSKNFILKCSACHNDYANGVIGPSLLGRSSDYIYDAIAKFKKGDKKNVLMSELIQMMPDKEIRQLADEIHEFNNQIKKMRNKK